MQRSTNGLLMTVLILAGQSRMGTADEPLFVSKPLSEPKQFTSYADLMTVCRWVSVAEGKENHFDVVKDLVGNNIFVPLKSKRQKASRLCNQDSLNHQRDAIVKDTKLYLASRF